MSDLQSTLDAIDQHAVDECGWCQKPLNPDGPSPDFCNDVCQTAWIQRKHEVDELINYVEPTDIPAHAANQVEARSPETTPACGCAWCRTGSYLIQALRMARPGGLSDPNAPVVLGMDPAGGAVVAVQRTRDRNIHFQHVYDTAQLNEATQRAAEGIRRLGERMREASQQAAERLRNAFPDGMRPAWVMVDELQEQMRQRDQQTQFRREYFNQIVSTQDSEPLPEPMRRALELRRNRNTGPQQPQRAQRRIDPPRGIW